MTQLADEIKRIREEAGLSVIDLAELLGCARATVYYYESGQRVPSIEMAEQITKHCLAPKDTLRNLYTPILVYGEKEISK